jgi:hypothetical protein
VIDTRVQGVFASQGLLYGLACSGRASGGSASGYLDAIVLRGVGDGVLKQGTQGHGQAVTVAEHSHLVHGPCYQRLGA